MALGEGAPGGPGAGAGAGTPPAGALLPPSGELASLLASLGERDVSLGELLERSRSRGFGLLLVLSALPVATPLPAGGATIPFGVVCLALGLQLLAGRPAPTLPSFIARQRVPRSLIVALARAGPPALRAVERVSRPRLGALVDAPPFRTLSAAVVCLMAASIIIPLPLSNGVPALAILLLGLAMLTRDGLLVIAGWACAVLAAAVTALVLYTAVVLGRAAGGSLAGLLRSVLGG